MDPRWIAGAQHDAGVWGAQGGGVLESGISGSHQSCWRASARNSAGWRGHQSQVGRDMATPRENSVLTLQRKWKTLCQETPCWILLTCTSMSPSISFYICIPPIFFFKDKIFQGSAWNICLEAMGVLESEHKCQSKMIHISINVYIIIHYIIYIYILYWYSTNNMIQTSSTKNYNNPTKSWSVWVPGRPLNTGQVAFDRTVDRGMQFFDGLKVRAESEGTKELTSWIRVGYGWICNIWYM